MLRLNFREVRCRLNDYLAQGGNLCEEDMNRLFEIVMLSYFSSNSDTPSRLIYDMISDSGAPVDQYELSHSELILEIVEQIGATANNYFPHLRHPSPDEFLRGSVIADTLKITDAFMHGADNVVISVPKYHFQQLQHEVNHSSHSDRS